MNFAQLVGKVRLAGVDAAERAFDLIHNYASFDEMADAGRAELERIVTERSRVAGHKPAITRAMLASAQKGFEARMKELRAEHEGIEA